MNTALGRTMSRSIAHPRERRLYNGGACSQSLECIAAIFFLVRVGQTGGDAGRGTLFLRRGRQNPQLAISPTSPLHHSQKGCSSDYKPRKRRHNALQDSCPRRCFVRPRRSRCLLSHPGKRPCSSSGRASCRSRWWARSRERALEESSWTLCVLSCLSCCSLACLSARQRLMSSLPNKPAILLSNTSQFMQLDLFSNLVVTNGYTLKLAGQVQVNYLVSREFSSQCVRMEKCDTDRSPDVLHSSLHDRL